MSSSSVITFDRLFLAITCGDIYMVVSNRTWHALSPLTSYLTFWRFKFMQWPHPNIYAKGWPASVIYWNRVIKWVIPEKRVQNRRCSWDALHAAHTPTLNDMRNQDCTRGRVLHRCHWPNRITPGLLCYWALAVIKRWIRQRCRQ